MSTFVPFYSVIQSIAQGVQTVVTFTANSDFIPAQLVSFRVSKQSGMQELNNQQTLVLASTANTITVGIDSRNYTPFVFHSENGIQYPAIVVPAGSGVIPSAVPPQTQLADCFDNVPGN